VRDVLIYKPECPASNRDGRMQRKSRRKSIGVPAAHTPSDFTSVADLITSQPPAWLLEHLERWSYTLFMRHTVEAQQPTRAELLPVLIKVRDAAALLQRTIDNGAVREFLDAGDTQPIHQFPILQATLYELNFRADRASKSPNLVDTRGKPRAGRGPAFPDGAYPAQTYCAMHIVEAWKWFAGLYPAPRSRRAAEAAKLYWQLAGGGKRQGWGNDVLASWRHHLNKAVHTPVRKAAETLMEKDRAEIRRHLMESERSFAMLHGDDPAGD
jgi:hypothetical protein